MIRNTIQTPVSRWVRRSIYECRGVHRFRTSCTTNFKSFSTTFADNNLVSYMWKHTLYDTVCNGILPHINLS